MNLNLKFIFCALLLFYLYLLQETPRHAPHHDAVPRLPATPHPSNPGKFPSISLFCVQCAAVSLPVFVVDSIVSRGYQIGRAPAVKKPTGRRRPCHRRAQILTQKNTPTAASNWREVFSPSKGSFISGGVLHSILCVSFASYCAFPKHNTTTNARGRSHATTEKFSLSIITFFSVVLRRRDAAATHPERAIRGQVQTIDSPGVRVPRLHLQFAETTRK